MQIDKKFKIERAASKDKERDEIRYIHVAENRATATTGVMLAVVPCVVGAGDVPGPITPDSLRYAREHTLGDGVTNLYLKDEQVIVTEDASELSRNFSSHTKEGGEQLELIRADAPKNTPHEKAIVSVVPVVDADDVVVMLNPSMLKDLASALGSGDQLILRLKADEDHRVRQCIRVDVFGEDAGNAYGAIMPLGDKHE